MEEKDEMREPVDAHSRKRKGGLLNFFVEVKINEKK
jgi:hypothetical protein